MKKSVGKKGQVSAFIILAILIVAVIAIFLSITLKPGFQQEKVNPVVLPIHNFVEACVKQTGEDSILNIGNTGGYFISPELSVNNIAVYFDKGENNMPSKEKIESELSLYMNNMLFFCTRGFDDFPDFDVSQGEIKTKTVIEKNKVIFNVVYPISISKGEKTYSFEKFDAEIPAGLGVIYNVSEKIMQEQALHKKDICLTCLSDLAFENSLYIDMADYENNSVLFLITDENSEINGDYYSFSFVNKYT